MHHYREQIRNGNRSEMPGAVRASAGINTSEEDVTRLLHAVARIAGGDPPPVPYCQDIQTGDYQPAFSPSPPAAVIRGGPGAQHGTAGVR
jgi:hypothetical protein